MKLSLTRTMLGLMTFVAVITYFWPARQVYFHSDAMKELSDGTLADDQNWKTYLGRNDYSSRAWEAVDAAKLHWERKSYRSAIDEWWQVAANYRDTEAALAALDNVARGSVELGDRKTAVRAWELLIMLPDVTHIDGGFNLMNYRHDACVKLSEYYESKGHFAMAERFVSQAIYQDPIRDTCGVYASSVIMELENRLTNLRVIQGK